MSLILCIESGTSTCSVAIGYGQNILDIMESHEPSNNHAKNLTLFVKKILDRQSLQVSDLAAVAVSKGPGSYTGLRIGVSAAKGICYGANIPLIAIGSLNSMAYGAMEMIAQRKLKHTPEIICPMIDARRMEVYTQLFDKEGNSLSEVEAKILEEGSFNRILETNRILFFGSGSSKAINIIKHPNALFDENFLPSARYMTAKASELHMQKQFEDVAYFEPLYLKEFVATIAKNKVLGV